MNTHKLRLTFDRWGETWTVECPYDPADAARPCWPNSEHGKPDPAPTECVLIGWVDAEGEECITVEGSIVLPVMKVEWQGEAPEIFTKVEHGDIDRRPTGNNADD